MTIIVTGAVTSGTLSGLRTKIQLRGYATDTAPQVQNEMLNSVYRRIIGMRRWPFLLVSNDTTIATTSGDATYLLTLIDDLLHIDAVRVTQGTSYTDLEYLSPQQFRDYQHMDRDVGVPIYWTRLGDSINLWPAPNGVFTLNIDYHADAPDLVNDSDVCVIPPAYEDVLVWGAIAELTFRERDVEGHELAKQEYGSRLADMMNEYGVRQRQSSEQVPYSNQPFGDNTWSPWLN